MILTLSFITRIPCIFGLCKSVAVVKLKNFFNMKFFVAEKLSAMPSLEITYQSMDCSCSKFSEKNVSHVRMCLVLVYVGKSCCDYKAVYKYCALFNFLWTFKKFSEEPQLETLS